MVRIRGIIERTRMAVVGLGFIFESTDDPSTGMATEENLTTDDDVLTIGDADDINQTKWGMEIARVYEKTMVDLGVVLPTPNNGILE